MQSARFLCMRTEPTISGFGLGLRPSFAATLPATTRQLDFLEVIPENWIGSGGERRRTLEQCRERWPLVPHSVSLSLGGVDPLDDDFIEQARDFAAAIGAPFWSDHIACSRLSGAYAHDLLPVPFSWEAIDNLVGRFRAAEARLGVPVVLENPTYYARMPGSTLTEGRFLSEILEGCDAGFLLDVNNVYVNSCNHGFDPYALIDELPLERVVQLHMAGHSRGDVRVVDTHGAPVSEAVWQLYEHTIRRARRIVPTLIEWDSDIPSLDRLLDEVDTARARATLALASLVTEAA